MRKNHYAKNELCQQKSQSHIGKLLDHGLECKFCDESFGFKEDLIGHMRTHSINTIQNKGNFSVPIHEQSSYWTAKSSFLFLASDHTEADPNYTLGVDFWTMIFYNLKNSG